MSASFTLINLREPSRTMMLGNNEDIAINSFLIKVYDVISECKYHGINPRDNDIQHIKLIHYDENMPLNEFYFSISRMALVDDFNNTVSIRSQSGLYQLNQIAKKVSSSNEIFVQYNNKFNPSNFEYVDNEPNKNDKINKKSRKPINKLMSTLANNTNNDIDIDAITRNQLIPEITDTETQVNRLKNKHPKDWKKNKNDDESSDFTTEEEESFESYENSDAESIFDPDKLDDNDLEDLDPEELERLYEESQQIVNQKENELRNKKETLESKMKNYGRYVDRINDEKRMIRIIEEKEEQRKRIFDADKTVYYKVTKQLDEGIITQKEIPIFFKHKYPIFRYMDESSLLEDENEYKIYLLLFNEVNNKDNDMKTNDKSKLINTYQQNYIDSDEKQSMNDIYEKHKSIIINFSNYHHNYFSSTIKSYEEIIAEVSDDTEEDDEETINVNNDIENNKSEDDESDDDDESDESDDQSSYITSESESIDKMEIINEENEESDDESEENEKNGENDEN